MQSSVRKQSARRRTYVRAAFALLLGSSLLRGPITRADVHVDVRSDGVLVAGSSDAAYVVAVDDCSQVTSIALGAGSSTESHAVSEAVPSGAQGCDLHVRRRGEDRFAPAVRLTFNDGSTQSFNEAFHAETVAPSLTFESVSFAPSTDGKQRLVVALRAHDDVDLSYHYCVTAGVGAPARESWIISIGYEFARKRG